MTRYKPRDNRTPQTSVRRSKTSGPGFLTLLSQGILRLAGILLLLALIFIGLSNVVVRTQQYHQRQQAIIEQQREIDQYKQRRDKIHRELEHLSTLQGRIDLMHDMGWVIPGEKIVYIDIPEHVKEADKRYP